MIKNDNQLRHELARAGELQEEVNQIRSTYSGIEADILALGLEQEIEEIAARAREYSELRDSSIENAISELLSEPIVIERIGELLSKLRLAAGLTQSQLADQLDWKQSNISRFESENYTAQTLSKIVQYASALDVTLYIFPKLGHDPTPDSFEISPSRRQIETVTEEDDYELSEIWTKAIADIDSGPSREISSEASAARRLFDTETIALASA